MEPCDCNLAGEVKVSKQNDMSVYVEYNLDVIPTGQCSSYNNYTVTFDSNTGGSKDITLKNNTTGNTGTFVMNIPSGRYDDFELTVGSQCGGYNTVNVFKE